MAKVSLDKVSAKAAMSPALTRSRSRKVQPALKQRAEAFLAQAAADSSSPAKHKHVSSRKRKRGSVDAQASKGQALVPKEESTSSKPVRKVSKTSKTRFEALQERPDASEDLSSTPLLDEDDAESLMSRTQTKKVLKTKAAADAKEPQEKRLKIFRKQAPKTFHEKLHRATSQRYDWPHPGL